MLILDSHALLWFLMDPQRIPAGTLDLIEDEQRPAFVSVATLWEIAIKANLGKLAAPDDLEETIAAAGFGILAISPAHCRAYAALPFFKDHRDPFDRMLAVQALAEGYRLLSRDEKLDRYGVSRIWR